MPRLDELSSLNRSNLHVFVAGPGFGEGIALALPGRGWILVDGCRVVGAAHREDLPLRRLFERFRTDGERVSWMVLTHPHEDHAVGFAELLDILQPTRIGITGVGQPGPELFDEAMSWVDSIAGTSVTFRRREVLAAFSRMRSRRDDLVPLHAGVALKGTGKTSVTARAPLGAPLRDLLARYRGKWKELRARANSLSLVFEVEFGDTRIVLGGDMITKPDRGTGWKRILETRPELTSAAALKIPHHGSREAQHPDLISPATPAASWWVTPFARSGGGPLPMPDGVATLVDAHSPLRLTVMPTRESRQASRDRPALTVADYRECLQSTTAPSSWLRDAAEITAPALLQVFDPIWAGEFDDAGNVVEHWAGGSALCVTP